MHIYVKYVNLPTQWWLSGKESVCIAVDTGGAALIPEWEDPLEKEIETP